jgi:Spy/CpxP family protein refolding chaperone
MASNLRIGQGSVRAVRIPTRRKGITMQTRFQRQIRIAAFASALALAGGVFAQGPGGPHGPGPGGPPGEMLAQVLQDLKASLNLNTSQQLMWDAAAAQTRNAREQGRAQHDRVKTVLDAELAKAEPDLAAVATAADAVEAQGRALRHTVRDQWLAVYSTFSPAQKAVVRDALKQRLARMEEFRGKMLREHGPGRG